MIAQRTGGEERNVPPPVAIATTINRPQFLMFQKVDYFFLFAAFASFVASVALWFLFNHEYGSYVGLWVPSILILWVGVRVVLLARGSATANRRN